ncbi:MAG: hypothetical protein K9M57_06910 [Phycisphaerae bacterium]|nr:hypothetical protein [Phycisphaerae bacterium]
MGHKVGQFVMSIEDEFKFSIPDDQMGECSTVSDFVEF